MSALQSATQSASTANYGAIFAGFAAKGIADVQPRVNVFTLKAWGELGRRVKVGEHGVRVLSWIPMTKKDEQGIAQSIGRKPRTSYVFHVSQTIPRAGYSENLWQYALANGALKVDAKPEHNLDDSYGNSVGGQAKAIHEATVANRQAEIDGYYSTQFTPL